MKISLFKIGIGLTIFGMIWLTMIFYDGNRIIESFSLESTESASLKMYFEGKDIAYYKIFLPEFSGDSVFVQIMDQNHNIISDGVVETKMSVGYFDFETSGIYEIKISNLSNQPMNLEVEFGDSNGREMVIPGIITLVGGLVIVVTLYIKLRDYRIEQPDENIS